MCRFIVYFGNDKKVLEKMIYTGHNNIINQSHTIPYLPGIDINTSGRNYNSKLNIDGFGFSWLDNENNFLSYKNSIPIHQDHNLKNLSKVIESEILIFHLRANLLKCVSPLTHLNCHPFIFENICFVHNGCIFNFQSTKQYLYENIDINLRNNILGNTDSEIIFYLYLSFYKKSKNIRKALLEMISFLNKIKIGNKNLKMLLNIGIIFEDKSIFCRYGNCENIEPLSLYYNENENIICSEPIDDDKKYKIFPKNNILSVYKIKNEKCFKKEWIDIKLL